MIDFSQPFGSSGITSGVQAGAGFSQPLSSPFQPAQSYGGSPFGTGLASGVQAGAGFSQPIGSSFQPAPYNGSPFGPGIASGAQAGAGFSPYQSAGNYMPLGGAVGNPLAAQMMAMPNTGMSSAAQQATGPYMGNIGPANPLQAQMAPGGLQGGGLLSSTPQMPQQPQSPAFGYMNGNSPFSYMNGNTFRR